MLPAFHKIVIPFRKRCALYTNCLGNLLLRGMGDAIRLLVDCHQGRDQEPSSEDAPRLGPPSHLNSYRLPEQGLTQELWTLHLTDEQASMVADTLSLGEPVYNFNVSKANIDKGQVRFR